MPRASARLACRSCLTTVSDSRLVPGPSAPHRVSRAHRKPRRAWSDARCARYVRVVVVVAGRVAGTIERVGVVRGIRGYILYGCVSALYLRNAHTHTRHGFAERSPGAGRPRSPDASLPHPELRPLRRSQSRRGRARHRLARPVPPTRVLDGSADLCSVGNGKRAVYFVVDKGRRFHTHPAARTLLQGRAADARAQLARGPWRDPKAALAAHSST